MAIEVTPARVRSTAALAALELRDDEVAAIAQQLQRVVDHIAELDAMDLSLVPPTAHVFGESLSLRDDLPREGILRDDALSQASVSDRGAFVVPRFVEE